ncbi:hypothetical protein [Bacillus fonticola]|uniref:hypothetical protein n=1 Tax=Bacillus fonticola TaxID=2728853 RepID=UPI0014729428|nr:hypothetical protein [Bacillus fonticola]
MAHNHESWTNEDEELQKWLREYKVESPTDEDVQMTIESLRQFVPQPADYRQIAAPAPKSRRQMITELLHHSAKELLYVQPLFWVWNIGLFLVGVLLLVNAGQNWENLFLFLAPLPFLYGLTEVLRGRDAELTELEASCRYSYAQIFVSRVLVVSVMNLLLTSGLVLVIQLQTQLVTLDFLLRYWFFPSAILSALALVVVSSIRVRSSFVLVLFISIWGGTVFLLQTMNELKFTYESLSTLTLVAGWLISIVVLLWKIRDIVRRDQDATRRKAIV